MNDSKLIKVGVLGLGVVGSELVSLIRKNALRIELETGVKIEVSRIFVRTMDKMRSIDTTGLTLTTNSTDIINDPEISIVCECMGGNGFEESAQMVQSCLINRKHVIMSSKKTLAKHADRLLEAAFSNKVQLKYDATVGGGIPIAKVLEHSFKGDELTRIYGVFNATSNFIYSKMYEERQSYSLALQDAQERGYAENDPSDDVDGFDSLYKLVILTMFGIKKIINPDLINPESFRHIDVKDMEYARELGYRIKPVSALSVSKESFACKVAPFLVPEKHVVAQASNNFNAIIMEGKTCGELGFYGQGAGAGPTATAMFDDLVSLLNPGNFTENFPYQLVEKEKLEVLTARYYIRFSVKNKAGILSKISGIMAGFEVNIERIIQKIEHIDDIELVLITSQMDSTLLEHIRNKCLDVDLTVVAVYPLVQ